MDVDTAFLNSECDEDIWVTLPPFWTENGVVFGKDYCCKLRKALYGLKQAPRLWQLTLKAALKDLGFEPLVNDSSVYINRKLHMLIVTYVDDFLILGKKGTDFDQLKVKLGKRFAMTDLGPVSHFLGVRITRDWSANKVYLCQDAYIKKVLAKYEMSECHAVTAPFATGSEIHMIPYEGQSSKKDIHLYGSMVGSLNYCVSYTRPDIAYHVSVLARFLANPSPQHIKCCKHVLQYLKGTIYLAQEIGGDFTNTSAMQLQAYCDSDWAGDRVTRKSQSGFVVFFCGGIISSSSKR